MRSVGGTYSMPKNLNIESSVGNGNITLSVFFFPMILNNPFSFKEYPKYNARLRCAMLNALLPVKYNIANEYSFGGEYIKSTRLTVGSSGMRASP